MQQPLLLKTSPTLRWYQAPRLWLVVFLAGLVLVYWPTFNVLHERWTQWDGTYAHGYFMVVVCLYAVITRLPDHFIVPRYSMIVLLAGFSVGLLWSAGYATQVGLVEQVAVYGAVLVLTLTVSGWSGAWSVAFPLALLTLSIPLWEVLIPFLQALTTVVATWIVRLLEIPAFIEENSFTLPFGTVVVAGGCAGLNYLMMGIALSSINALYSGFSLRQSILSIGLLVALAVIGNWGRVSALIFIAYQSQMQSPLVYDHGMFGWWIFAGLFVVYLFAVTRIRESDVKSTREPVSRVPVSVSKISLFIFFMLVGLVVMPIYVRGQSVSTTEIHTVESDELRPMSSIRGDALFQHGFQGVDLSEYFEVQGAFGRWHVARLTYFRQVQGKELISSSNELTALSARPLASKVLSEAGFQAVVIIGPQPELIIWQYMVGSTATTDPIQGKINQLIEVLNGRPAVALWLARTDCNGASCKSELSAVESNLDQFKARLNEPLTLY